MSPKMSLFAGWYHRLALWSVSFPVAPGVPLPLPMFWMGRNIGFRLAGMPMSGGMRAGMGLILLGYAAAAYGLLPRDRKSHIDYGAVVPPEDAPLTRAHWMQIGLLALALVIDVMKASS